MKFKLFYKKDYEFMKSENSQLNGVIRKLKSENSELKEQVNNLTIDLDKCMDIKSDLEFKLLEKNNLLKEISGAKGGLTKKVNELTKELESKTNEIRDLNIKLKESMSDKYLVKKVRAGRTPKSIKTANIRPVKNSVQKFQKKLEKMEV